MTPLGPEAAQAALLKAAGDWLEAAGPFDGDDPWRLAISRLRRFWPLNGPPPAEGVRTMLPAPPGEALSNVAALMSSGQAAKALAAAEDLVSTHLFWLDAHLASFEALAALDRPLGASVVQGEAARLTARWPILMTLTFDDGTPLASGRARDWLKSPAESQDAAPSDLDRYKSLSAGNPVEAIGRLSDPAERPADGRARLAKRVAEAGVWLRLRNLPVAIGLADHLVGELDRLELEAYDPLLAAEALKAAHEIYSSPPPDPARAAKAAAAASRLALLSPSDALALKFAVED
jgi:hypothetical protein